MINLLQLYKYIEVKNTKRQTLKLDLPAGYLSEPLSELKDILIAFEENNNNQQFCYEGILQDNIIVIDIDNKQGDSNEDLYNQLLESTNLLSMSSLPFYTNTKSGGFHLYYQLEKGFTKEMLVDNLSHIFKDKGHNIEIKKQSITTPFSNVINKNGELGYYTLTTNNNNSIPALDHSFLLSDNKDNILAEDNSSFIEMRESLRTYIYDRTNFSYENIISHTLPEAGNNAEWIKFCYLLLTITSLRENFKEVSDFKTDLGYAIAQAYNKIGINKYSVEDCQRGIDNLISNKTQEQYLSILKANYKRIFKIGKALYSSLNVYKEETYTKFSSFIKNNMLLVSTKMNFTLYFRDKDNYHLNVVAETNEITLYKNILKAFGEDVIISAEILKEKAWLYPAISDSHFSLEGKNKILIKSAFYKLDLEKLFNTKAKVFKELTYEHDTILTKECSYTYDADLEQFATIQDYEGTKVNLLNHKIWEHPKTLAKKGDWSILKTHLYNLLNAEEEKDKLFNYLMYLYALKIQKPTDSHTDEVICILDKGGTGKSRWGMVLDYMQGALGVYDVMANKENKECYIGRRFIYINEIPKGKNNEIINLSKQLTEPILSSRKLYQNATTIKNYSMLHIFANPTGLFDNEESRRRWVILNPSSGNPLFGSLRPALEEAHGEELATAYYTGLGNLHNKGENVARDQINAFIDYLLNFDVSKPVKKVISVATIDSNEAQSSNKFMTALENLSGDISGVDLNDKIAVDKFLDIKNLELKNIVHESSGKNLTYSLKKAYQNTSFSIKDNKLYLKIHSSALTQILSTAFYKGSSTKFCKKLVKELSGVQGVELKSSLKIYSNVSTGYLIEIK